MSHNISGGFVKKHAGTHCRSMCFRDFIVTQAVGFPAASSF
jgi:hypothetical protein